MALSSTTNRVSFAGNGSTTAFSFPYYFLLDADLVVVLRVNSTGVETTKTITTHYTVSGAANPAGGTVTMLTAPASGETLIIYRDPAITQGLDLVANDGLPAEDLEKSLDRLTMIAQRLDSRMDRSVRLTDGYSATFDPSLPGILTADAVLKVNAAGDALEMGPSAADISAAAASAAAAAASATAAAASATAASTSETNAASSATAAATSETNAASSASSASTSASTATTQASNAASSASSASTSASNASSSASSASTSASTATTQASNAASSASAAATSASNAATSETNAAASAATITSGNYVTKSGTEALTNKDYQGGTASNTSRLTVPKAVKATLDGLTRKEATLVYATDASKLYVDNGSSLVAVGTGSGGGINYLSANPDAEVDTSGWATYADAAGTSPVDGTGGSPSSTFTRSTSSPLVGTASFLWTKSAANSQGEGFSFDFTIDSAYKGQPLAINYVYEVTSGTYATGDMTVWIYDKTNATLIQPSAYQVVSTAIPGPAQALVFQASSDSTSYRLIFHTSTTSTSAYSLKFDNVSVGPQIVPVGPAMTDWAAYTPTGTWTTNTTYTGFWKRVGDMMLVRAQVALSGAPSGTFSMTIPSGYTIDTAKLGSGLFSYGQNLGSAQALVTGSSWDAAMVGYNSSNSVAVWILSSGTTNAFSQLTATAPASFQNADYVWLDFKVPIIGWSSNTIVSDSAATRAVYARMYRNTSQTGINPNNSYVKINVDTISFDSVGMGNVASNRLDVKVPGAYRIEGQFSSASTNVLNNQYVLGIYKNGSLLQVGQAIDSFATTALYLTVSTTDVANVGDYYELFLYGAGNNSASTLSSGTGSTGNTLAASMIQGPAQIQATALVALTASGSGTHTSSGSFQDIPTVSVVNTSVGMLSGTTITAPVAGYYNINGAIGFASNSTGLRGGQLVITGASSGNQSLGQVTPVTGGVDTHFSFSQTIYMNAGDTVKVQGYQNSGGSLGYTSATRINFFKVGGVN